MMNNGRTHGLSFYADASDTSFPDPEGFLHDSRKGWLRKIAYRSLMRKIPFDGSTSLARSVLTRMLARNSRPHGEYSPGNLSGPEEFEGRYRVVPVMPITNSVGQSAALSGLPLAEVA